MGLNVASNSGFSGNRGAKSLSSIGSGGATWAEISNSSTGSYTDSDGNWMYWLFASNTTMVVTKTGYLDCLIVSGGPGRYTGAPWGGGTAGGSYSYGLMKFSVGSVSITIGGAGANTSTSWDEARSGPTILGSYKAPGTGNDTTSNDRSITSSITGTSYIYCQTSTPSKYGGGGLTSSGGSGVVIVRRPL